MNTKDGLPGATYGIGYTNSKEHERVTYWNESSINPKVAGYPGLQTGEVLEDGLRILKDVAVPLRDGVKIYYNIFLPADLGVNEKVPGLICWSPYGKHSPETRGLKNYPYDSGVDFSRVRYVLLLLQMC